MSSLDKLVKGSDDFPIMNSIVAEENKQRLLLKKGIYPYEYMDSFERFGETKLPDKEKFYSSLDDIWMPKSWRIPQSVRGPRLFVTSRSL